MVSDEYHNAEIERLRKELETERMRLAACGVVAMSNTPESAAACRKMHPDYWCASVQDVINAVDREMALREENERLRKMATHLANEIVFRSVFVTEDTAVTWPDWFVEKWGNLCWFSAERHGVFASRREAKTYMTWMDLPGDIQKAMTWENRKTFVLVYLHECGGITRCQIERNRVLWSEPKNWRVTEGVEHDYCYGCSDVDPDQDD